MVVWGEVVIAVTFGRIGATRYACDIGDLIQD